MTMLKRKTPVSNFQSRITIKDSLKVFSVEIETERLIIRPFCSADLNVAKRIYGDIQLTKYFDHGTPRTETEVIELIGQYKSKSANGFLGLFSIFTKEGQQLVGYVDLVGANTPGTLEIGYILDSKFHNLGFATEAVKALLLDYIPKLNAQGIKANGSPINAVMATVHPQNIPSKNLLERLGMKCQRFIKRFGQPRIEYLIKLHTPSKNKIKGLNHGYTSTRLEPSTIS